MNRSSISNMKKLINGEPHALCKDCNQFKKRLHMGKKGSRNRKVYHGEDGREWDGKRCPQCRYLNAKVVQIAPNRTCKFVKSDGHVCGKKLPIERYFNCLGCVEELESDDDSFAIYA